MNPAGNIVDSTDVGCIWWWQHVEGADLAAVRQTCGRNALSEIAAHTNDRDVRFAVGKIVGAYAAYLEKSRRQLQRDGTLGIQNTLDWAQICADRVVQEAVTDLWRLVLVRHRRTWEQERDKLVIKWTDPTSPLHDMRNRLEADD